MKIVLAVLLLAAPLARAKIHADVSVRHGESDLGSFTIELFHGKAPQTVANFIRLAKGSAPWVDEATGTVQSGKPFYDGLTFHRVIKDFMSQTGSPNGQGTDGPGYMFRDEVDNGLVFDAPYLVAMANSGPNTNGSQFFVTAAATSWLDGKHTIFGKVVAGQAVCDAINTVETEAGDKPVMPVVIESIVIRKEGLGEDFDENAQSLPVVSAPSPLAVRHDASGTALLFDQPARTHAAASHSADLQSWEIVDRYLDYQASPADLLDMGEAVGDATRQFFAAALTNYPEDAVFPDSMAGRTLTSVSEVGTFVFIFDSNGGGTWTFDQAPPDGEIELNGTIDDSINEPHGYGTYLRMALDGINYPYVRLRLGDDTTKPLRLEGRQTGVISRTFGGMYGPPNGSTVLDIEGTFELTR